MSIQVKFRRGSATQHLSFTGANGEITVDTTNQTLRVHDGVTVGGIRLAKLSEVSGSTSGYLQVANASALYTTKAYAAANSYVKSTLANTNSYIATKLNTTTFYSALANTNSYIASRATWSALTSTNTSIRVLTSDRLQVANATTLFATKASWSGLTGTNTALRILISDRLQIANAVATYQTKTIERAALANTNLYIATKASWTGLTGTNTALRTLVSDRLQVANARSYMQVANVKSYLANTNSYTATKVNTTTFNSALANTNAYINTVVVSGGATWSGLTSTNTALRTLISDRYQVANVNTLLANKSSWSALTGTNTALSILISDRLQVANAVSTYTTKINPTTSGFNFHTGRMEISTNLYISGNTLINGLLANNSLGIPGYALKTNGSSVYWDAIAASGPGTGATWAALTGTNTALRILISDRMQVANTKAYLANTNAYIATKVNTTTFNSALANTNAYIASKASLSELTSTNTSIRTLVSDRLQVANAVATYQTKSVERAALANTNAYIASKSSWTALTGTNTAIRTLVSDRYQVANVNTLLAAKATLTGLNGTNTALRLLINDRLQVANAVAIGAGKASWAALTGTNTAIRALVSDRYQVANVNTNFLKKSGTVPQVVNPNVSFSANVAIQGKLTVYGGVQTYSANNLTISDNMIYLNSGSTVSNPDMGFAGNYNDGTYHHAGFFRDASDAGTWKVFENYSLEPDANTFINTVHASFKLAPFSARDARFTGVLSVTANTSVGNTTVGGFLKLGGTDIRATFAQNTYVKTTLANTNLRVNLINTNLTSTNTALRLLISDRYQVANVNTLLNAKATWAGLTGTNTAIRTLVSDRYQVANVNTLLAAKATWTGLTATNTALRTLISDRLQVANASSTYLTKNNPVITGTLTANASVGTAGYYLRSSGTGIYWSPVAAGGGSSSNAFSSVIVGANTAVAAASGAPLTFVAGSGMTIVANPTTDTITFVARATPRVLASASNSATPTLNTDNYDMMVITGQSVAITSFTTNLTGTPVNGQKLWIAITGTTAIAITWGASFESSTVTLPSTTVTTNRLDIGFVWNAATTTWRCVASA